jgi:hypothetical protein
VQRSWRERLQYATRALLAKVLTAMFFGVVFLLIGGLTFGLAAGLSVGLFVALFAGLVLILDDFWGSDVIASDPPRRYSHARPDAVLTASRSHGLARGLGFGLVGGLALGIFLGLQYGLARGLATGLATGLALALPTGVGSGIGGGLDAWLYHHWLRRRLSAQGVLPTGLPGFLEWCAQEERGWLRISDAYEFRHRGLLDHLSPRPPAD